MYRFLSIFILILFILTICLFSCQKEQVCGVNNPMNDLPWLKKIKNDAKSHHKLYRVKIYQCLYKDGTGFSMGTSKIFASLFHSVI
jgi:hypothetical protein